jgi:hypothetical protein
MQAVLGAVMAGIAIMMAIGIIGAIAYAVLIAAAALLALAVWLAPFWYYAIRGEPTNDEFALRMKEIGSIHVIILLIAPFAVIAAHGYNAFGLQQILLSNGAKMGPQEVKAVLYSAFVFVFSFGFAAYFLKEIFPWKDSAPVFNNFLSFLSAFFLASFTALVVYDGKSTSTAVTDTASRFSDFASTALSILFLMMGVYLFWKKVKAYF